MKILKEQVLVEQNLDSLNKYKYVTHLDRKALIYMEHASLKNEMKMFPKELLCYLFDSPINGLNGIVHQVFKTHNSEIMEDLNNSLTIEDPNFAYRRNYVYSRKVTNSEDGNTGILFVNIVLGTSIPFYKGIRILASNVDEIIKDIQSNHPGLEWYINNKSGWFMPYIFVSNCTMGFKSFVKNRWTGKYQAFDKHPFTKYPYEKQSAQLPEDQFIPITNIMSFESIEVQDSEFEKLVLFQSKFN